MKFTINKKAFDKIIAKVSRAISNKTTIPILTGVKMVTTDNELVVTGSDADISIRLHVTPDKKNRLNIAEKGRIVLPATFFKKVVKSMPGTDVSLTTDKNFQVKIASGKSHFNINGLDAGNYPKLPDVKGNSSKPITLSGDLLKEVIRDTAIDASHQESRPLLTGIHVVVKDGKFKAVATDSHRLGARVLDDTHTDADFDLVIPAKSLTTLSRLIGDHENVKLYSMINQVLFQIGDMEFLSRLFEGNYPDTSQLIPTNFKTALQVKASALRDTIDRSALVSHASSNNVVALELKPDTSQLKVISNSIDIGQNEEHMEAKISGKDITISFNPDYMVDALKTLGDQTVNIGFISPLRPFVLDPSLDKNGKFKQLITPVRTF